ncbi:MotA/TolQ/ExbB proton channel family protein [Aliivibrio sp. S4TY2]|jgi:biopolymer transport protein ExbB|uniref:MotA/TolQ/ExbB proton channel family protein n=1 Tax=unclassified Aliivibrio TaxID=2645654 RepID=UPI002379903D|nr:MULTISPECIES: MotA/TolQ/ExbB proton channel family protein [unclassified Aliivibrio]MDD9156648.1 MotA/TolQ/ExbB proton channel family protein [Aliivibrio sp. S4TY2]MDD9159915.1 MotA/TolQ/ExbB proton channel family protein [Aliivibrio sp. S4TY1]MDD9164137.1 MotA/TolQ/ExbB proton channel family protein [Aliivibrio sp. S4MY2]MDD9168355.1 MotA/TolQ/ExbB proton channel family protein [Aliivibrio sp. S4MY4]MDD9184691.1 MotA/TolQ/ExbB proton channel family protein [Aliivibrio sp. S4MY3]
MLELFNRYFPTISDFMSQGGVVLWWLMLVVLMVFFLVIERISFLFFVFPKRKKQWLMQWKNRNERTSWYALANKEGLLQLANSQLYQHLSLIKVFVSLCPMIGLLGTVTGMISVFDIMAQQGSSDPKLMASGISMATLPTMAGMVAALVGLFAHARLLKVMTRHEYRLEQALRSDECA